MQSEDELRKQLSGLFNDFEAEAQEQSWEMIRSAVSERQTFSEIFSDFEAEPSSESWDTIKNANEDNLLKSVLATILLDFEAEPTAESWDTIKIGIEDQNLKNILSTKFSDFEAEPKSESWENIHSNLDEKTLKGIFAETFSDFEAQPTSESWDTIQANLDKDVALKAELSSLFAHYESEPTAESWVTIKANIQKEDDDRGIIIPLFYRLGIAASIAILLGFFLWNYNKDAGNQSGISQNANRETTGKLDDKPKVDDVQTTQKANTSSENDIKTRTENVALNRDFSLMSSNSKLNRKPKTKVTYELSKNEENLAINQSNPNDSKPSTSFNTHEVSTKLADISSIESKEFDGSGFKKEPLIIAQNNIEEEIYPEIEPERRSRNPLILTGNLMPIQTYQVFTILPQSSTTYIQQVGQLSALDNQRLGVQARFGVMKNTSKKSSVGLSLAYTGMQQWASYSVSNGVYDVEVGANDEVTVTPVTESIAEESFLHALGLKFEHSYMVTKRRSKIYLIGGGEAVRKLNKNQFGYYLNASIGVSYPIVKNNSLWIEPTIRYGLTSSFDNNNYLKIRPYNIGLNFRVNIGK